jgi:UbiD family decarboxylase
MTAFRDLRDYIDRLATEIGPHAVQTIDGAHWDLEIGCIAELSATKVGPALLFDDIVGYPRGYRVFTNYMGTPAACAVALGLPAHTPNIEIVRAWKDRSRRLEPMPPKDVGTGSILENVLTGEDVDLLMFPTPRWHEHDGGRYIGTACMVITRDPDSGWVNVGTYRACIQGRDRLSLWMLSTRHARVIAEKYWARGEACPIAVVVGSDPTLAAAAAVSAPAGTSEYDIAGALRGEPVEILYPPGSDLPMPAHAEIVIEGVMPSVDEETAHEGPFGEWTGYYTHSGPETVIRVTRVLHRDDPIILGAPPMIPTITPGDQAVPLYAASATWEHLERAGVQHVRGVWAFGRQLMIVIAIEQVAEGQAMQTLLAAAGRARGGGMDRYFVVVDDDIDVSDLEHVLWAMCTRVDPAESVQIVRTMTSAIDPRVSPAKRSAGDFSSGIVLIDACKPFRWKDEYARPNRFDDEHRSAVRDKWASVLRL